MGEIIKRGLVPYSFKLRPDRWVTLLLPADLTRADIDQLVRQLQTLVVERGTIDDDD